MAEPVIRHPIAETVEFSVKPAPRRGDVAGARIGLYGNMNGAGEPVTMPVED